MAKRTKKTTAKVKPPSRRIVKPTQVEIETPPFHITFPITLILKKENKNCYFQCEHHLNSYLKKANLKKTDYKVLETVPKTQE